MPWIAKITRSALDKFPTLEPTEEEFEQVLAHLGRLEQLTYPGKRVPFDMNRDLLYSDVGRFRIIFKLTHSWWYPPDRLNVLDFVDLS